MTPQYYVLKMTARTPYSDLEEAREAAESIDLSPGEEAAILVPIAITRRSVTTTWLSQKGGDLPPHAPAHWSWPTLPPRHSYLNPENLTVEQLGDGWRPLCTLDESYPIDHQILLSTGWAPGIPCGFARPYGKSITYRTRAPIPTLQ